MSTAVASLLALGAAVLCVREIHRWMEGAIIVQVENDSERSVLNLEVVLPGDSAIIDSAPRGGTASLRLRPLGDGSRLLRSSSFDGPPLRPRVRP